MNKRIPINPVKAVSPSIGRFRISHAIGAAVGGLMNLLALGTDAHAATITTTFDANAVTETNALSDFLDDDVDVEGTLGTAEQFANVGDVIIINYEFTKGPYKIFSSDSGDVDFAYLTVTGFGTGGMATIKSVFELINCDDQVFTSATYTKTVTTNTLQFVSADDDDVLGSHQDETIKALRITSTLTAAGGGNPSITGAGFGFEWDDIELKTAETSTDVSTIPLPPSALLLISGFAAMGWRRVRRADTDTAG